MNGYRAYDPWFKDNQPDMYMTMIETAETVASRYKLSREYQDEYSLQSQQRTAAGQQRGAFDDEIVPLTAKMKVQDKETGEISDKEFRLEKTDDYKTGKDSGLETLQDLKFVDVRSQTLGTGFAGVMKRYNFAGLRASHGVSVSHLSLIHI